MNKRPYRRLPGSAITLFRRRTLWLGPDHILSVRSLPFTQEYRRFYFRDIQAIVLTRSGNQWAYYLSASAAFLALMFFALGYTWHLIGAVVCGITALVLLVVSFLTPNAACYLQTATSVEPLPSLGRRRAAHRAIAILRPAIESVQGTLSLETLREQVHLLAPPPLT